MVWVLNPTGSAGPRTTRRRANHGTSTGVRASWPTRRSRYGDSGDSPAAQALHALGITNLGLRRGRGGPAAKRRASRQRGLPAYWKKVISSAGARARKARPASRRARSASPKRTTARRPNAYFYNTEAHARHARVKWGRESWPNIALYDFIKRYGVLGGQRAYERYLREQGTTLTRRRGGGSKRGVPAHRGKESGMTRRKKSRRNPRGRRKSALALFAPKKRRRKAHRKARRNPAPKRRRKVRSVRRTRSRRRKNPPILWAANPAPKRRRRRKNARRVARRGRARRRNPPILWAANPRRGRRLKIRHVRRAGRRRGNPDFSAKGIMAALKEAIPTLEDAKNIGVMTGFTLAQELLAWRIFDKIGFPIWNYVPHGDQIVFTLLGTVGATLLGGRRWAQPVMYAGLTNIASAFAREHMVRGTFGLGVQGFASQYSKGLSGYGDYVTLPGARRAGPIGDRMSDYVTMSGDSEDAAACIESGSYGQSFGVGGDAESLADYYGVTAV